MSAGSFVGKCGVCARVSFLAFVVLLFVVVLPLRVVYAAPLTVDVTPSGGLVGTTVTVSGVDATAFGEVRFYVENVYFASTVANETGGYSVDIVLPAVPADTYSILALDVASGDTASTSFSVEPRILLTPEEGSYNDAVTVTGDGFSEYSLIMITFDSIDVTPFPQPETNELGSFSAVIYVPLMPNGTYAVSADDGVFAATAFFDVVPKLMLMRTSGAATSLVFGLGYGFAASANYTLTFDGFDVTPRDPSLNVTNSEGSLIAVFLVPLVADGVYTVKAVDSDGNAASAPFVVPGPILSLSPDRASGATIVTASGVGFQPRAPILLYLEDITMTSLLDLVWMSPSLMADEHGLFEYSFVVPVTAPGVYSVSAYMMLEAPPAEPVWLASAPLTIVDGSPLDVAVNVGSLHFRGELAEFYVETSFGGQPVDVTVNNAKLYWNGTLKQDLTSSAAHVATGLYRIPYPVPADASVGVYNLVVEVSYATGLVESFGTSSGSFLVSAGFSDQKARLIDVQDKIGTIVIPDLGVIRANLTTINARLVSMDGREATIASDIGTLKADADTIDAKVTSVDGDVATILSDLGTIKSQMASPETPVDMATLILALVAAVGGMLSVVLIQKLKPPSTPAPKPTVPASPETPPPASVTTEATETPAAPEPTEMSKNEDSPSE